MATKKREQKTKVTNDDLIIKIIVSIVIVTILLVAVFRLGTIGIIFNNFLRYILGELYLLTVLSIIFLCVYFVFLEKKFKLSAKVVIGIILLNITVILAFALAKAGDSTGTGVFDAYFSIDPKLLSDNGLSYGGGLIGMFLYVGISALFGKIGTIVLIVALAIIDAILIVPLKYYERLFIKVKDTSGDLKIKHQEKKLEKEMTKVKKDTYLDVIKTEQKKEEIDRPVNNHAFIDIDERPFKNEVINEKEEDPRPTVEETRILKKSTNFKGYKRPSISVFEDVANTKASSINRSSAEIKGATLIKILKNFDIDATLIATHIGPSVTKFELKPDSSVKVSKILNIQDNIKMELAARDIRIEAPIPGRSAVGVEIPNAEVIPVRMKELIKMDKNDKESILTFYLGKDLMGRLVTCEIDKMPHLLIAGATGSGKSVCINAIITSLLYRTDPSEVKMVLVDPKKVEFTPYHDVPHLLWPVITDATMANNMLKKVVVMMEERYDIFAEFGAKNIKSYNQMVDDFNSQNKDPEKTMVHLPYIVVIIDELADLMMIAGKEVEASIQRITQLARACGIHLIVATQRPSTDVITGIIKSNIPSRISFSVASSIDSRTILDQTGAERLLGNGDMLYFPQGEPSPIRLQGVFVTDQEVRSITNYVKAQAKPEYDDTYFAFLNNAKEGGMVASTKGERDELYEEVKAYVIEVQKASTSLLQRRFGIGYNRAAGLIESLEDNGIIGPAQGSKPREVYIKNETEEAEEDEL